MIAVTIHSDLRAQEEKICPVPNQQQLKWKLAVRSVHYSFHLLCSLERKEKLIPLFFFPFHCNSSSSGSRWDLSCTCTSPSRPLSGTAAGTNPDRFRSHTCSRKEQLEKQRKCYRGHLCFGRANLQASQEEGSTSPPTDAARISWSPFSSPAAVDQTAQPLSRNHHLVQHCYEILRVREATGATRLGAWFWDDENHCLWEGFKKSRLGKIATSLSQAWKLYRVDWTTDISNQLRGGYRKTEGGSSSGSYKYRKWPHWNFFWERRIRNEWVGPGHLADVVKTPARTQRQCSLKRKPRSPVLLPVYFWWNLSSVW